MTELKRIETVPPPRRWRLGIAAICALLALILGATAGPSRASTGPPAPPAHAATAWPIPSYLFVGADENGKAEVNAPGGAILFEAGIFHATSATWKLGRFKTVRMHHGYDPLLTVYTAPGSRTWIGSSSQKGIVNVFQNHLHNTYILRIWDHTAFAKYSARWDCNHPSWYVYGSTCKITVKLLFSHG